MSQDLLSQIKEAEEKAEKEINDFDQILKKEREDKISSLNEKISLIKKDHKERLLNLETELRGEFDKIDKEFESNIEKDKDSLEKKAKTKAESFFSEILN